MRGFLTIGGLLTNDILEKFYLPKSLRDYMQDLVYCKEDIVRTVWRHTEYIRNNIPPFLRCNIIVGLYPVGAQSFEGIWPQYERTRLGESLVYRLFRQEHAG